MRMDAFFTPKNEIVKKLLRKTFTKLLQCGIISDVGGDFLSFMNIETSKNLILKRAIALILCILIGMSTVGTAWGFEFGYAVSVENEVVGVFASEEKAHGLFDYIYEADGIKVLGETKVFVKLVEPKSFTTYDEAADNYRKNDSRYESAYTFTLDGVEIYSAATLHEANDIANEFLSRFHEEGAEITFAKENHIKNDYVVKGAFTNREEALELLSGAASISSITRRTEYVFVPVEEMIVEDPLMFKGERVVVTEGTPGEKYVEYECEKVNGETAYEFVSGETVIAEMAKTVVKVGTKEIPVGVATGTFINPTTGVLTSPFGPRWERMHNGIDVADKKGTDIVAADGGVVVLSETQSGYGKVIKIDHGNGYMTVYAHCNALYVKEGAKVAKGDVIAAMGNTGRSTGTHLHFEIRKDNVALDPLGYVKY